MLTPAYRLRVYAPRSVSPTESTVLTPRAGADHSDPFQIATVQGVAGYQPYLADLPKGRRTAIDPLTKKADIGALTFRVGDKALTSNLIRWATAFVGDANGEQLLTGRRVEVDESLDFDTASPGTATWTRYFTGRIVNPRLDGKLVIELVVHEMTDDLDVNVFIGQPAATVSSFAFQSQLYPLGLLQAYGPFPTVKKARGHIAAPQLVGYDAFALTVDPNQADPGRLIAPRVLIDKLTTSAAPSFNQRLVITRLDTMATTEWELPRAITWSTSLEKMAAAQVTGAAPATVPPVGTAVEFYIKPIKYAVDEKVPLLINDVHPATLIRHLLSGAFGVLDANGNPTWSVPYNAASFAAIEADTTFPVWRSFETKKKKLNETIEAICQRSHLAYFPNASGEIVLVDLRRTSSVVPAFTLTSADTIAGGTPTWEPDATQAVSSVTVTFYAEQQIDPSDLPKPFEHLKNGEYARDKAPDIPAVRIEEPYTEILEVLQAGPRVGDVKGKDVAIDDRGSRYGLTGSPDPANGLPSVAEQLNGKARSDVLRGWLTAIASELRAPYALGPVTDGVEFKRAAVANITAGTYVLLRIDELPDPASDRRGGDRLALVTGRTENGMSVALDFLDAGANAIAVTPSIATPTNVGPNGLADVVTLNAAGDPVQFMVALTDTTVVVRPADTSPLWGHAPQLITASGSVTVDKLPAGRRAWVKARSIPGAGQGFKLPSSWATPTGTGYVDLPAVGAPTGLTVTDDHGYADLAWTNADALHRIDVFLTTGASLPLTFLDVVRVNRLDPGSHFYSVGPLTLGTQYTVGVRAVDEYGGVSAMTTVTFTQASAAALDEPVDPTGFACSQDDRGVITIDGTYGLAVIAADVPGMVEFSEALETGVGSGAFGAAAVVARVPAVLGNWTKCVRRAPNDGLRRRMTARSVNDPAPASTDTDPVDVMPWTPLALPPLPTALVVEITVLPPSPPTDEGLKLHFQVGCVDPLGTPCTVQIVSLSGAATIATGPAIGVDSPNDTQWRVVLPPVGSGPSVMVLRGTSPDGRTTDLTVSLPAQGNANANALAMRLRQTSAKDATVTFEVYVADASPDPSAVIEVRALGQGVSAVVAEDGTRTAVMGSLDNMLGTAAADLSQWADFHAGATTIDPTVAGPDGVLGRVWKMIAPVGGDFIQFSAAVANFIGVTLSGRVWAKAAAVGPSIEVAAIDHATSTRLATTGAVPLTANWALYDFSAAGAASSATLDMLIQCGAGTIYLWAPALVTGAFAPVTDDLDTTDFVKFVVTRPPKSSTARNVLLSSDAIGTAPWATGGGTETVTDNAATFAGISFSLLTAANTGPWGQTLTVEDDGVHVIGVKLHAHAGDTGVIELGLRDQTTATHLALGDLTVAADGSMSFAGITGAGAFISLEALDEGVYQLWMRSPALDHTHTFFMYAAAGTCPSYYVGKFHLIAQPDPFGADITTTTSPATLTIDNPSGLVSFTATRNGKDPVSHAVVVTPSGATSDPAPLITLEGEATARDGNGQGMVRLLVNFDEKTNEIGVYASESPATGGAAVGSSEDDFSGSIKREEGVIASDDNWQTEYDIATTASYYRQVSAWIYGGGAAGGSASFGVKLPPIKFFEQRAVDTGTAPSAPPTALAVAFSTVNGLQRATITWTCGDVTASHRVFRNGIVLARVKPGVATLVDDGLTPGKAYTYRVQAVKNGQTSEFAGGAGSSGTGGSSGSSTLVAPSFAPGYPTGGSGLIGDPSYVNIRVVNTNPGASTLVFISPTTADSGTFDIAANLPPGVTDVTIQADTYGLGAGDSRYFYLVATQTGNTDSAQSTHKTATFRPDP